MSENLQKCLKAKRKYRGKRQKNWKYRQKSRKTVNISSISSKIKEEILKTAKNVKNDQYVKKLLKTRQKCLKPIENIKNSQNTDKNVQN